MTAWLLLLVGAVLLNPGTVRNRLRQRPWQVPRRRNRRAVRTPEAIEEMLSAFRDELLSGAALRPAFERAAQAAGGGVCPEALAVCRMGGQVPPALRSDAAGEPILLSLAALWQVCEGSGGALAAAVDRLVVGARQAGRVRLEVRAQLAGPRATMRILALLPLIGLVMGLLMGADPLGFLLGSVWGWLCLAAAVALEAAGLFWVRALVRRIEAQI